MASKLKLPFGLNEAVHSRLALLPDSADDDSDSSIRQKFAVEVIPDLWLADDHGSSHERPQFTTIDRDSEVVDSSRSERSESGVRRPNFLRSLEEADEASGTEHENPDLTRTGYHVVQTAIGPVEFRGDALLCTCPDCQAPMTIRTSLGLADCWRCPASVALDERTISQLASESARHRHDNPVESTTLRQRQDRLPLEVPVPASEPQPLLESASRLNLDPADELAHLTRRSSLAGAIRRAFRITPAWLVSFLLHVIAILILAIIVFGDSVEKFAESITLSTFIDSADVVGGDIRLENPIDTLQDDVALAARMEEGADEIREAIVTAARDAMELRADTRDTPQLPDLETVRENITTRSGDSMSFAARDPRVRAEIVKKEGGTNLTEASVARGLRWLASVQNRDGSWSLKNYSQSKRASNKGDSMGTALALLPFLGAGQTHEFGVYQKNVAGGLKWLLENQKANGDLRGNTTSQAGMYAHGQATIVLCEALALSGDRQFLDPVQRAIRFIEKAQHQKGGWRYRPGQAGDTSIFGWQMMALQSAKASGMGVDIDPNVMARADRYLDSAASQPRGRKKLLSGSAYAYQPRREATEIMTAEAILCRMYLGWRKDDPRLKAAVNWLVESHLPSSRDRNLYYWYYGTQVMHHYGGQPWEKWNKRIRTLLVESQATRGRYPGSWPPGDFEWGDQGGRIYTTAMAVCTLEVYYRHLPLFKQLELD